MDPAPSELLAEARLARREHRLHDAAAILEQCVVQCRRADGAGDPRDLLLALNALGQIERDLGEPAEAIALVEEALALCRAAGEPLAIAHTVRHLGDILVEAGQEGARACYEEALALYRATPAAPPLDVANALRPMAKLLEGCGEGEAARAVWQQARALYQSVGVVAGVEEADRHLAVHP